MEFPLLLTKEFLPRQLPGVFHIIGKLTKSFSSNEGLRLHLYGLHTVDGCLNQLVDLLCQTEIMRLLDRHLSGELTSFLLKRIAENISLRNIVP